MLATFNQKLEEVERKHAEHLARDYISRTAFEENKRQTNEVNKKLKDAQIVIEMLQEKEREVNDQLLEKEKSLGDLKKCIDDATLRASKAVLERSKAVNENLLLEDKIKRLTSRLDKVENEKHELLRKFENPGFFMEQPLMRSRKGRSLSSNASDGSHSGYTSEDVPITRGAAAPRFNNSSPDLGIESDTGRVSSVEIASAQADLLRTVEISSSALDVVRDINQEITHLSKRMNDEDFDMQNAEGNRPHDCEKIEQEYSELKKKYNRTRRALEDTWSKLRSANHRKEQIERDIRQQIMKTQNVLKNVRTNMEIELEQKKENKGKNA